MRSRYPTTKVSSYCYHPIHVVDDTKDIYVPCGKCDGCRLHKANEWSQRLGMDMESNPNSIFFSLTWNNKYLPKLIYDKKQHRLISDHDLNIRFDSKKDVLRKDNIVLQEKSFVKITHFDGDFLPYASKRDVQLWLKILRKKIFEIYGNREKNTNIRYFIISEFGPSTYRPHLHGVLLPEDRSVAETIMSERLIYSCWQMCDENRVVPFTHFADSGAKGYVTQYLTCSANLPKIYQLCKEVRPWRLSSKTQAVGLATFSTEEVFENVSRGNLEYTRVIPRLGTKNVLCYPSYLLRRLFPKCYRYGVSSDARIQFVYGGLLRNICIGGYPNTLYSSWLRAFMHPNDYAAAKAAARFCTNRFALTHYLYTLDMLYYKRSMNVLSKWYFEQQNMNIPARSFDFLLMYNNWNEVIQGARSNLGNWSLTFDLFFSSLGLDMSPFDIDARTIYKGHNMTDEQYIKEVDKIKQDMIKQSKYNELSGNCPHV